MAAESWFFSLLPVLLISVVQGGSVCISEYRQNDKEIQEFTYCSYGCCGYYYDSDCCSNNFGAIVGIVTACLVLVGIIVAIIVIIACNKKKGEVGIVIVSSRQFHEQNHSDISQQAFTSYPSSPASFYPKPPAYNSPIPEKY